MLVAFRGVAFILAAIALYGVMASTVSQGTRELALRVAHSLRCDPRLQLRRRTARRSVPIELECRLVQKPLNFEFVPGALRA